MLAILATHPIQYQIPVWKQLAASGKIPFEVWYLTSHGVEPSLDVQFGKIFKWDIDMLGGYPHRFPLDSAAQKLGGFWDVRLPSDFRKRLKSGEITALLVHGWDVLACWEAVFWAHHLGIQVWLRGESNDLKVDSLLKKCGKKLLLRAFFKKIDRFLSIGKANGRLYQGYGIKPDKISLSPYCVDNSRFAAQAAKKRSNRLILRKNWKIEDEAFCVLFVGKFISKKRPGDIIAALQRLKVMDPSRHYHVLFVGAGELGLELRRECQIAFDSENTISSVTKAEKPLASFAGFLNQSDISDAYVAADVLVLPSDAQETWGLVVNEALASRLPCVVSDACGSAEDLVVPLDPQMCFHMGDSLALAQSIMHLAENPLPVERIDHHISKFDFSVTVNAMENLWDEKKE